MRNGVDEGIAELAAYHVMNIPDTPDLPDELPQTPTQLLWLLDAVAGPLVILVDRNPNEPDLQYAVNILAQFEKHAPKIWKTYPPFMVANIVVALVYRFRVAKYQGTSLARWGQTIHARYEQSCRSSSRG